MSDELNRLKESEFPYSHPKEALTALGQVIERDIEILKKIGSLDNEVVKHKCSLIVSRLGKILHLLGFLLRSTNVRNAFEIIGPLLRLSRTLLSEERTNETRLIVSSEWCYSPFIYTHDWLYSLLPNFVLIGFPAHESANPLLVPLAGHELGHAYWSKNDFVEKYRSPLTQKMVELLSGPLWLEFEKTFDLAGLEPTEISNDIISIHYWNEALQWALRQCEESFCDFLGLRIFGGAYVEAFAYLLCPSTSGHRTEIYPSLETRMKNLSSASAEYKLTVREECLTCFVGTPSPQLSKQETFRLRLADAAHASMVPTLIDDAGSIATSTSGLLQLCCDELEIDSISHRMECVIPAEHTKGVVNIVNAGWRKYNDKSLWIELQHVQDKKKALKELVLKNLELYEIEQILAEARVSRGETNAQS